MKVINLIIEIITSPFTILFRTKAQRNFSKPVKPLVVLGISIVITAALLMLFYYKELFKLW
ncbi:hypothetical protein EI71_01942 [Anaeroplasma bactoclasticum]|jgi:hypothetical protein|uniref:Uncharacterized protein n=2 Tax=Anaeroplasma bactoclasticum TaxID=2088 RepID=A0A397R2V5_9MOLU|nr:hypothetical protein EI71_01942 [Anaeroplasma bactoclasticum]